MHYGQKAERIKLALGLNKSIQEEVLVYNRLVLWGQNEISLCLSPWYVPAA